MIADYGPAQKLLVAFPVQSTQQIRQAVVEFKDLLIHLRKHGLIRIQRRESLQLNEFGLQVASLVAYEAKVHLDEHGVRRLARYIELRGDGIERCCAIL